MPKTLICKTDLFSDVDKSLKYEKNPFEKSFSTSCQEDKWNCARWTVAATHQHHDDIVCYYYLQLQYVR